jgi:hypothetical protein
MYRAAARHKGCEFALLKCCRVPHSSTIDRKDERHRTAATDTSWAVRLSLTRSMKLHTRRTLFPDALTQH